MRCRIPASSRGPVEKTLLVACLLAVLLTGLVRANEVRANEGDDCFAGAGLPVIQWEVLAAVDRAEVADSALNPGNLLARLPLESRLLEARPDISAACGVVKISLSPRYAVVRHETESHLGTLQVTNDTRDSLFLNEAMLRVNIGSQWSLEASRQALLWGPSMFYSPSNPFATDNGRNTPHLELRGQDFLIAQAFVGESGVLSLYDNVDDGAADDGVAGEVFEHFEKTQAISYEYTAFAWSGRVIAAHKKSADLLGGYAQYTLNDYVVLFTDFASKQMPPFSAASRLDAGNDWHESITLGGAYTFEEGANLSAEYFYNGSGLSEAQYAAVLMTGDEVNSQRVTGPVDADYFVDTLTYLGDVLLERPVSLQRHYAALQLNKNDIGERLDAVLRWTHGIEERGNLFVTDLNLNTSEHVDVFLTLIATQGGRDSEFRQFYDQRVTLGTRVMF